MQIRQLFEKLLGLDQFQRSNSVSEEQKSFYGRTAFNGVLRHNDRVASVQKLMHTYQRVDKFLQTKNQSEEALIDHITK